MRSLFFVCCFSSLLLADSVAGLKWTAPAGWNSQGKTAMRAATYVIPPAAGDRDNAECAVYFFGAGQGGSVQANLDRWKGQFTGPNGRPAEAKVQNRTVHGLPVTTIDASGDYSGMGGPMARERTVARDYRLLGAIVEGPEGSVFVKFAGPAKTIAAHQRQFDELVNSFAKQ
jgi:hypothetical protein